MKINLLFLLALVFSSFAFAQEVKCGEKELQLSQYIADNDHKKAIELWKDLKTSCPNYSEKIYLSCSRELQYQIEIADSKDKESKVNDLLDLYNQYDKYFPNNKNGNYEKRAITLFTYKVGKPEDLYYFLNQAFEKEKETFANSQAIYNYFEFYFTHYKENKSIIPLEQLLDKYCAVSSLISENSKKFPFNKDEYHRVELAIDLLLDNILTKENIIPYAQKKIDTNSIDNTWLESTAKALFKKCKNNSIFEIVAKKLDDVNPSSISAYYLATYYLNTGNQDNAIEYYKKSAEISSDPIEKATTYYAIATITATSDRATSEKMIFKALESNPKNGRYYVFLANLYANSFEECATNEIEKKGIYKLASNTVLKAAIVESRLKPTADAMSVEYLKKSVFDSKTKVKSVKIGCWIQQTVQF